MPLSNDDEELDVLEADSIIEDETQPVRRPAARPSSNVRRQPQRHHRDEENWDDHRPAQNSHTAIVIAIVAAVIGLAFAAVAGLALFLWMRPVEAPHGGQQQIAHNGQQPVVVDSNTVQPVPNPLPEPQPVPNPQPNPIPNPVQPVVPPIVQPAQPQPGPLGQLKYAWQPNREYPYKLTIDATLGQATERTSGICTYHVSDAPITVTAPPEKGSGTAFVVNPNGLLVTCSHVVGDARTIEVMLNGQKYPATVVAQNPARDIAVIRIQAENLPTVPLGDSEAVQLAQPIRVIGFPLSDVLGQNIKVTTGTVSGLNQDLTGKIIQTDASINPGNSGGPVVNDFGEVVGIASAKLTGNDVSTVGFAVPINDVKTLLQQNRLEVPQALVAKQKLDGPMLAERVTRATALVHVVVGASERRSSLKFSGNFSTIKMQRNIQLGVPPTLPRTEAGSGKLVLDEFGKILHFEGDQQLPYLLGPLGLLLIEPLSPAGLGGWTDSNQTTITRIESDGSPFGLSGFRSRLRGPPGFPSPFADNEKRTVFQASEQSTYAIGDTINDLVGIKVGYELKSHDHPTNPYVHLKGDGLWQFNKKEGVPHSVELKLQLTRNADNTVLKVPFTVRLDYVDPKTLAEERQVAEERRVAAQKQNDDKAWDELLKLPPPHHAKLVQRYRFEPTAQPRVMSMGPAGEILVATNSGQLQVYDRAKSEPVVEWKLPSSNTKSIVFNSDGKLATVTVGKQFAVFDLAQRQPGKVFDGTFFNFDQAAMSPNGKQLVGTTFKGEGEFFDMATGVRTVAPLGVRNALAMCLSDDGQKVFVMNGDTHATFDWSAKPSVSPITINRGDVGHVWAARLTSKGDAVLVGSRAAYWWDRDKNSATKKLECPASHFNGFALNSKGTLFASAENKSLVIYDIQKHTVIERWDADPSVVKMIEFSADGRYLMTLGTSRVLQVWELPMASSD